MSKAAVWKHTFPHSARRMSLLLEEGDVLHDFVLTRELERERAHVYADPLALVERSRVRRWRFGVPVTVSSAVVLFLPDFRHAAIIMDSWRNIAITQPLPCARFSRVRAPNY